MSSDSWRELGVSVVCKLDWGGDGKNFTILSTMINADRLVNNRGNLLDNTLLLREDGPGTLDSILLRQRSVVGHSARERAGSHIAL